MLVLPRVAFYPTLLYNVLLEKLGVRQWYHRIDDSVLLGALPFKSMTKEVQVVDGVNGVVNFHFNQRLKF